MVAMIVMIGAIFLPVFSYNLPMLFGGELLCGIPWGIFRKPVVALDKHAHDTETLTTAYAAEICPVHLRGYLAAFVNMCWGIGLLTSAGVVRGSITIESEWGYKMPFMLQWVLPLPLLILSFFAPES